MARLSSAAHPAMLPMLSGMVNSVLAKLTDSFCDSLKRSVLVGSPFTPGPSSTTYTLPASAPVTLRELSRMTSSKVCRSRSVAMARATSRSSPISLR